MNVINNIRRVYIKKFIFWFLMFSLFLFIFVMCATGIYTFGSPWYYWILEIGFGIMLVYMGIRFIKSLILAFNPDKDIVFRKFKSVDKLSEIIKQIYTNKIYEDKHIIFSNKYLTDKKDYTKTVSCEDVLGLHRNVIKKNGVTSYWELAVTDKYGCEIRFKYGFFYGDEVEKIIKLLSTVCPNAEVGFTRKQRKHIYDNYVDLDGHRKEVFTCSKCGALVEEDAEVCPKCGAKFED